MERIPNMFTFYLQWQLTDQILVTEVLGRGIPAIQYFKICQILGGCGECGVCVVYSWKSCWLSFLLQIQNSTSDSPYSQCVLLYLAERKGMVHFHLGTVVSHHQASSPSVSVCFPMACLLTSCTGGNENHVQRA